MNEEEKEGYTIIGVFSAALVLILSYCLWIYL